MNILYISHRIPYPPNKGDKIRSYNEIKYLSQFFNIYLCSLLDNYNDKKYIKDLKKICKTVDLIFLDKKKVFLKSLFYLISRKPLSIGYFYSKKLQKIINHRLRSLQFSNIFCFSSASAQYISCDYASRFGLITDFVDVDSQKWLQYSKYSSSFFSWFYKYESHRVFNYEIEVAKKSQVSFFVSQRERDLFKDKVGNINNGLGDIVVLPNGVDFDFFKPRNKDHKGCMNLLFSGTMDYYANIDAVVWFVKEIFPKLKEIFPEVKFYIAGANPSREVRELASKKDVIVTGFVDDIRLFYDMAAVYVAPLRIAQGIQNKILEAMSMEKAVVTTLKGFEGIDAVPGRDLLIANSKEEFFNQISFLLTNFKRRKEIGTSARRYILHSHRWDNNMSLLKDLLLHNK